MRAIRGLASAVRRSRYARLGIQHLPMATVVVRRRCIRPRSSCATKTRLQSVPVSDLLRAKDSRFWRLLAILVFELRTFLGSSVGGYARPSKVSRFLYLSPPLTPRSDIFYLQYVLS